MKCWRRHQPKQTARQRRQLAARAALDALSGSRPVQISIRSRVMHGEQVIKLGLLVHVLAANPSATRRADRALRRWYQGNRVRVEKSYLEHREGRWYVVHAVDLPCLADQQQVETELIRCGTEAYHALEK